MPGIQGGSFAFLAFFAFFAQEGQIQAKHLFSWIWLGPSILFRGYPIQDFSKSEVGLHWFYFFKGPDVTPGDQRVIG